MAAQFAMGTLAQAPFRPLQHSCMGRVGFRSQQPAVVVQKRSRTLLRTTADTADTAAVETEASPHIPSAKKLVLFALPTLVLPLADPVMSLIDTICIGSYGTVVELAATGPASLLFASASQLFSAFSATALADISRALSKGDRVEASDAFARAIRDAAIAGGFVLFLFGVFHLQLIQALNVSPEVVPTAARYLAIRAFAAPAATASAVLAASLLAQHDTHSPCIIVAASSVFSLLCDVTLIVYFRLGLTGAAASTVVTQYLGLAALIHACMLPGRLMPTIPEFNFLKFSVPDVPKMIPKLPWKVVKTRCAPEQTVSSSDFDPMVVNSSNSNRSDSGTGDADLNSSQGRPGGRARVLLVKREASDAISPRSTEHSDTQQYPDQERSKEAALPPATVTVNVAAAAIGTDMVATAGGSSSETIEVGAAGGTIDLTGATEEPVDSDPEGYDTSEDSDDVAEDSIAVASGEYLDPRFDGVPTEWDESFDDLRSVEMDVALTLQAAAKPSGMGAMLPFGSQDEADTDDEAVQLEGRMGYAGSNISIDDADNVSTAEDDPTVPSSEAQESYGHSNSDTTDPSSEVLMPSGAAEEKKTSKAEAVTAAKSEDRKADQTAAAAVVVDSTQSEPTEATAPVVKETEKARKAKEQKVQAVEDMRQIFRTAEATSSMDESTAATPATPPEASADVAKDAPEVDQKINAVSAVAEVAAADNGSAFQEAALAADIGDSGDKLEEGDEWSEATGTSRQISVTFARSTSVDSSFTSPAEEKEKKKPAAGGGGLALAMVYAAKLGCYFIVQGAAMRLSVVELAAHNAVFSIWNACAYFPVPLQTTALAFVPACTTFPALAKVTRVITVSAVALTVPLAMLCAAVPLGLPHLLTGDPKVAACMRSLAPIAAASILACTLDVACEGLLVAQGKLKQLLITMCGVLTLVAAYFYTGRGLTLNGTWGGLLLFFGLRSMLSASGVAWQTMAARRAAQQEEAEAESSPSMEDDSKGDDEGGSADNPSQQTPQLAPA